MMKPPVKKRTAAATASQFENTLAEKNDSPTPETRMTPITMCLISAGLNLSPDLDELAWGPAYARMSGGIIALTSDCL